MSRYFVLNGHEVVPTDDVHVWGRMFDDERNAERIVGAETIGDASVSTVFLGVDHNWGAGPPLLFETMIFGGKHADDMWRYSTWDQAEAAHNSIVAALKAGTDPGERDESP